MRDGSNVVVVWWVVWDAAAKPRLCRAAVLRESIHREEGRPPPPRLPTYRRHGDRGPDRGVCVAALLRGQCRQCAAPPCSGCRGHGQAQAPGRPERPKPSPRASVHLRKGHRGRSRGGQRGPDGNGEPKGALLEQEPRGHAPGPRAPRRHRGRRIHRHLRTPSRPVSRPRPRHARRDPRRTCRHPHVAAADRPQGRRAAHARVQVRRGGKVLRAANEDLSRGRAIVQGHGHGRDCVVRGADGQGWEALPAGRQDDAFGPGPLQPPVRQKHGGARAQGAPGMAGEDGGEGVGEKDRVVRGGPVAIESATVFHDIRVTSVWRRDLG